MTDLHWIDGDPQMEAIAASVYERCEHSDSGLVIDDPRNIAVACMAALTALPEPADRAAEEMRHWKSKLSAVTAGRDSLQRENARLKRELANVDRLRTNADFHLGQEMARRQRAEKAAAGLTADRVAVLLEAADVAEQVGRRVHANAPTERRAEGAWETAAALRRTADEAQQSEEAWPSESQWRVEMFDPGADQWVPAGSLTTKLEAERRMARAAERTPQWADDGTEVRRRIVRTTVTYTVEPEEANR